MHEMKMKLATSRITTRLPSPLKLPSPARAIGRSNTLHKPLLVATGESSEGGGRGSSRDSRSNKVPKGFVAVYVGPRFRRFVIPISFLGMPELKVLLENVAEEFGCDHHGGAIEIPCDEEHFERILMPCFARQRMTAPKKPKMRLIHV